MTAISKRVFPIDPYQLLPAITPDNEPFWSALAQGRLQLQACDGCGQVRNPIAPACPYCGSNAWQWRVMSGEGVVFSFARFHKCYLPEFADLMPYAVLTVELAEGARMFGRLIERGEHGKQGVAPRIGAPVRLAIEQWPDGRCVAAFELK